MNPTPIASEAKVCFHYASTSICIVIPGSLIRPLITGAAIVGTALGIGMLFYLLNKE